MISYASELPTTLTLLSFTQHQGSTAATPLFQHILPHKYLLSRFFCCISTIDFRQAGMPESLPRPGSQARNDSPTPSAAPSPRLSLFRSNSDHSSARSCSTCDRLSHSMPSRASYRRTRRSEWARTDSRRKSGGLTLVLTDQSGAKVYVDLAGIGWRSAR